MMIPIRSAGALVLALFMPSGASSQPAVPLAPGTTLFQLDLSGTPIGEFPTSIRQLKGMMEVVRQGGVPMLKASAASEFLITLPQVLPQDFTLEFDLVPKQGSNPQDLSFEGTPAINQGTGSAHLLWHATGSLAVIGGGGDTYESPMPEALRASLPGVLTHVVADFQGPTVKLYTNGQRHYTLDKQFARGRVLRVFLGGQDDGTEAVYLAGLRISTGSGLGIIAAQAGLPTRPNPPPAPPAANNQSTAAAGGANRVVPGVAVTQGAGGPVVTWGLLGGVSSYSVKRWMLNNPTCCNNTSGTLSGPPWQDTPLAVAGTYIYEVTASTPGWVATGQTQFIQFKTGGQIATIAPPPPPTVPIAGSNPVLRSGTTTTLAPPANLAITGTPAMATLTWQAPSGWTPTGYTVLRKTVGTSVSALLTASSISVTRFDDQSGFTTGQTYEYVVTALSSNPVAFGAAQARFMPPAPQNVSNLIAQQTGTSVTVSWAPLPGVTTYLVNGSSPALSSQVPGSQNRINFPNVPPGTHSWTVGARYEPGPIETPAATWPSITLSLLDPNPVIVDGKLYKEASRAEVYQVLDGKKIHIPTPDALRVMGYTFADVTPVVDGALVNKNLFQFASASATPGSLVFPIRDPYAPIPGVPGSTRFKSQGLDSYVTELRGWLWWTERLDGCDGEGDLKYGLEVDSDWAVRQGIDLHRILWVGNLGPSGGGIGEPGGTSRALVVRPLISMELNAYTWHGVNTDNALRPAGWDAMKDCGNGTFYYPFDPDLPALNARTLPDIGASPAQRGPYVRVAGTLITDSPHTYTIADLGTWLAYNFGSSQGTTQADWNAAALDWHPGVDPLKDPSHYARWTEVHPPDLIEPATPPANPATLKAIGLAARPTECQSAILTVKPDIAQPPGATLAWEEIVGPETYWPNGKNAQNGSWITNVGNAILVNASVCGGGVGKSPGRFKAFYRVWWK